jgi:hypothetical protein
MMANDERAQFEATISELANASQAVALLATRLRQTLGTVNDDAVTLEASVDRIVKAVRRLQPRAE